MAKPSAKPVRHQALGRGLGALLPQAEKPEPGSAQAVIEIPIARIDPNPVQPRIDFNAEALRELAASIRSDGVLQPVLVSPAGDRFTLVVGERRLKACRLAGLKTVPGIVRDIAPDKLLEVTLIENVQREDLNPIEVALALDRMVEDLHLIHEELAVRTGMSRASITNHLRLLRLPASVQKLVRERRLQMGHARALLPLDRPSDQETLAEHAARSRLSVREVEKMVRKVLRPARPRNRRTVDPNVAAAIEELERVLQTPVRLRQRSAEKGCLEIAYSSQDELAAIYDRIVGPPE